MLILIVLMHTHATCPSHIRFTRRVWVTGATAVAELTGPEAGVSQIRSTEMGLEKYALYIGKK